MTGVGAVKPENTGHAIKSRWDRNCGISAACYRTSIVVRHCIFWFYRNLPTRHSSIRYISLDMCGNVYHCKGEGCTAKPALLELPSLEKKFENAPKMCIQN